MGALRKTFPRWFAALAALALAAWSASALAAELVMFERSGCVWCLRWEREIGPIYPKTDEGRVAPLRHVSLDHGPPTGMNLAEPVFYTPTFVLMHDGREVGRITGYIGDDAFWGLLSGLIGKLPPKAGSEGGPNSVPRRTAFTYRTEE